jgi:hypothetical protein
MSTAHKFPAATAEKRSTGNENSHGALMREMGAENGYYDPIPPDQYMAFLEPGFSLSPSGQRLLACLRSHTIRAKSGGRTPWAAVGKRPMKLKDFAVELEWEKPRVSKAWAELEDFGLARKDEQGRLRLAGKVQPKSAVLRRQIEGEDNGENDGDFEKKVSCTDNFPDYLLLQFQQLNEKRRSQAVFGYDALQKWRKNAEAEAMQLVRSKLQQVEDQYWQNFGIEARRVEKKTTAAAPRGIVTLDLLQQPELVVQNFLELAVQNAEEALYTGKADTVQQPGPYIGRETNQSESSSSTQGPPARTKQNPLPTPTTTKKAPASSSPQTKTKTGLDGSAADRAIVAQALDPYALPEPQAIADLMRCCQEAAPDVSPAEIAQAIEIKAPLSNGRVIGFLLTALPAFFANGGVDLLREQSRKREPASCPTESDNSPTGEWQRLLTFIQEFPDHPDTPLLREDLRSLAAEFPAHELAAATRAELKAND